MGGVTTGLLSLNEEVTWEATHFFVRQKLTSRITSFARPEYFRDSQVRGAFARFDHDHFFYEDGSGSTRMVDHFDFTSPCGWLGRLADSLFLERYMRQFLLQRNLFIKNAAENLGRLG